jgi:hypothetical protein
MAVGWIDTIYNNSDSHITFGSRDDQNNGVLQEGPGSPLELSKNQRVAPKSRYHAEFCGIPWYFQGKHYKMLSMNKEIPPGVQFYQSEIEGNNWIIFEDMQTGRRIARQRVPNVDYHCNLILNNDDVLIEVVNDQSVSWEQFMQAYDEFGKWVDRGIKIGQLIMKGMK